MKVWVVLEDSIDHRTSLRDIYDTPEAAQARVREIENNGWQWWGPRSSLRIEERGVQLDPKRMWGA